MVDLHSTLTDFARRLTQSAYRAISVSKVQLVSVKRAL